MENTNDWQPISKFDKSQVCRFEFYLPDNQYCTGYFSQWHNCFYSNGIKIEPINFRKIQP